MLIHKWIKVSVVNYYNHREECLKLDLLLMIVIRKGNFCIVFLAFNIWNIFLPIRLHTITKKCKITNLPRC